MIYHSIYYIYIHRYVVIVSCCTIRHSKYLYNDHIMITSQACRLHVDYVCFLCYIFSIFVRF